MSTSATDLNQQVIEEFRANDGVVGGPFAGATLLLLHHTGAKSGRSYINPLVHRRDGDRYVIFASAAGAPQHPAWYHNLQAHPEVKIEVGSEALTVVATDAEAPERDRLYGAQAQDSTQFAEYEQKAGRTIPVVLLTPTGQSAT
jgi:deazaflavin-dependent oxidoreductase (nitroreductase family)